MAGGGTPRAAPIAPPPAPTTSARTVRQAVSKYVDRRGRNSAIAGSATTSAYDSMAARRSYLGASFTG